MAATRTALKPVSSQRRRLADEPLTAIIDIGSNSIRLVVYRGLNRTPEILFNEKVMAGLGRGVASTGNLSEEGMASALTALSRFALLCEDMGVDSLRAVATAAVREAGNSAEFLAKVRDACGLEIEVISGETEARTAALGVIAGIPDADGVVGDLGGGSLELVRVAGGEAHERLSLPIGSLKLDVVRKRGTRALTKFVNEALDLLAWAAAGRGKPFYAVGGSWRALAQLHMYQTECPLPVIHQYEMAPDTPARLVRTLSRMQPKSLKAVPNISSSRIASLPGAAVLLNAVVKRLGSSAVIASAYGLREGMLYSALPPEVRAEDPLIAACRAEGRRQGRFPEHGDVLMAWMDDLFAGEGAEDRRLRLASSLLSDVAWRAHPDFRAERGVDIALHGNWSGVTPKGRAMMASALHACFGGSPNQPYLAVLQRLAEPAALSRARLWGLALRLGQRLTGGTTAALLGSRLMREEDMLLLVVNAAHAPLYGEAVIRRHRSLASAMGLTPKFIVEG